MLQPLQVTNARNVPVEFSWKNKFRRFYEIKHSVCYHIYSAKPTNHLHRTFALLSSSLGYAFAAWNMLHSLISTFLLAFHNLHKFSFNSWKAYELLALLYSKIAKFNLVSEVAKSSTLFRLCSAFRRNFRGDSFGKRKSGRDGKSRAPGAALKD